MPGILFGELAGAIALFAMLIESETTQRPELLRTILGGIHGLMVLAGLELLLWELPVEPGWLGFVLRVGNVFNFVVALVMVAIAFPERSKSGSTWSMWEATFAPVLYTGIWTVVSALLFGRTLDGAEAARSSAMFLGMHYYVVSGVLIVMLLIQPPGTAPAAALDLDKRLMSGFGLFWLALMAAWWGQAWFMFEAHAELVFGGSWASAVIGGVLSLVGVVRTVQHARRQLGN